MGGELIAVVVHPIRTRTRQVGVPDNLGPTTQARLRGARPLQGSERPVV
jgi:hypothetical protein